MHSEKISISVPNQLTAFLDAYRINHACKSRSEVVQAAIKLLQERELEAAYREASEEVDSAFETTTFDGLDNETW